MEEKHLLVLIIVVLNFIVLFVIWALLRKPKAGVAKIVTKNDGEVTSNKKNIYTIEQLVDIVANRNSTKNDLTNAVLKVSKSFPFPKKQKGRVTKEGKIYLNFVLLVASHRNADAKLVAFMNTELKKSNKDYTKEIDIYESEGISQRGARI